MASGIARGRVRTTTTTASKNFLGDHFPGELGNQARLGSRAFSSLCEPSVYEPNGLYFAETKRKETRKSNDM